MEDFRFSSEKNIQTGLGPIAIRQPRIRHRDDGKFTSAILPPYLRRTQSIDAVISALKEYPPWIFRELWRQFWEKMLKDYHPQISLD